MPDRAVVSHGASPRGRLGKQGLGGSQWGIRVGAPYFGLSLSMVREAEEMRLGVPD